MPTLEQYEKFVRRVENTHAIVGEMRDQARSDRVRSLLDYCIEFIAMDLATLEDEGEE